MSDAGAPARIAVAKGRVLDEALPLLARAGFAAADAPDGRRLILDTADPGVKLIVVRSADVPTYVEHGGAELGIVGKDVLLEHDGQSLYEMLDLGIARCRMMVAGRDGARDGARRVRVATKYVNSTRRHFARKGEQVELIRLRGAMELAPLAGLADLIVDLVDTGATLRENGLRALEEVAPSSARLVVNKAAMKIRHADMIRIVGRFEAALA